MNQPLPSPTWNEEVARSHAEIEWLWHGLLAAGNLTLLTGGWKSGKTSLVALLLDRRRQGGLLLNRPVRPGATVIVSEESKTLWTQRQSRLDFGPDVAFWCRPFSGRPTPELFHALLDQIVELRRSHNVDLAIIDPLAMFLPACENHSASLLAALADLQRLTEAGLGVLLLHHPAKGDPRPGQAARGTGALAAAVDILLELRIPRGDSATRRRRLFGFARYEETPRRLALELNPAGTDYAIFTDTEDDPYYHSVLPILLTILEHSPTPLTRQEIHTAWPTSLPTPDPATLWRWLRRAVGVNLLAAFGTGTKIDPYRYALAKRAVG